MRLLDRSGWIEDPFVRVETAEIEGQGHVLVPRSVLAEALVRKGGNQQVGVEVANFTPIDELKPVLDSVALISVVFPAFADGRGFSLARLLRTEGYAGTLRANGPLIPDQFAYALACGFDQVELSDEHAAKKPIEQWQHAAGTISHGYQRGYGEAENILDQRRAARRREVRHAG